MATFDHFNDAVKHRKIEPSLQKLTLESAIKLHSLNSTQFIKNLSEINEKKNLKERKSDGYTIIFLEVLE